MAILSADGTTILNNYDRYTGIQFNATKVSLWYDGSTMDDSKVDNVIYFKNPATLNGGYSRRTDEGFVLLKSYGLGLSGLTNLIAENAHPIKTIIITEEIDLNGEELTIPDGLILDFKGGSFRNGAIHGTNTIIRADLYQIVDNVVISGTWLINEAYPEWTGAFGDGSDVSDKVENVLQFHASEVVFNLGIYGFSTGINIKNSNIIIKRNATLKALAAMEYLLIAKYPVPSTMGMTTVPFINGGGTIDANGLADVALSFEGGYRVCVTELHIKNPLVYALKASIIDGTSGNLYIDKLVLRNEMGITTSAGIYANRTDCTYSEIAIVDFKI